TQPLQLPSQSLVLGQQRIFLRRELRDPLLHAAFRLGFFLLLTLSRFLCFSRGLAGLGLLLRGRRLGGRGRRGGCLLRRNSTFSRRSAGRGFFRRHVMTSVYLRFLGVM